MKKMLALLMACLLMVTVIGCSSEPDFKLTGTQKAGVYTFYPISDKDAEPDPILGVTLNYICGKCTDVIVENVVDSEMEALYLYVKDKDKDEYIVPISSSNDLPDFDESKIKNKSVVIYGMTMSNIDTGSARIDIQPFYIGVGEEIYNTTEFIDHLAK